MKKYQLVIIIIVLGVALLGTYWGAFHYVPPMKEGEVKIGVITTSISDYSSDLVIYNQDLKVQRIKPLNKYAGIGVGGEKAAIINRNFFTGMSGIMQVGKIDEFISIDMENERVSEYPVSNNFLVAGVGANRKYAYSFTNLNGVSVLTQYQQSDKKEIKKVSYPVLFNWVAATDMYLFVEAIGDIGANSSSGEYCEVYVFDAETLELIRIINLSQYGSPYYDGNYLITEDSLYIPICFKPKAHSNLKREQEELLTNDYSAEKDSKEERERERKRYIESLNNKIVKLSLEDFSVSVIELNRKTPRRIEKKGETLFILHEDTADEEAYLTVYNEKTNRQQSYNMGDLFNITFALSKDSLYLVAVDDKVGYYFIYRYDIREDNTLELTKVELLEMNDSKGGRGIGGMFVYTKED